MSDTLIRAWAHAPWHSWIKDEPRWCDLLSEVFARLPRKALAEVLRPSRPLIFLPPVHGGRLTRLSALPGGALILQLDAQLLERPRVEALGIIAHELAHACVGADDVQADRLAASWGFTLEIRQALEADLPDEDPRVLSIRSAA